MSENLEKQERATPTGGRGDEAHGAGCGLPETPGGADSLEDEIRLRAYYRYLERETEPRAEAEPEPGDEVTDWLEAESDVLGRRATGVEADERARDNGA